MTAPPVEKRRYTRLIPHTFSISKMQAMWIRGVKIKDITEQMNVSAATVNRTAKSYGWPPRKAWNRRKYNPQSLWVPKMVKRRCELCLGFYECTAGDYTSHDCESLRRAYSDAA